MMKGRRQKQLYDELCALIGRQGFKERLSPEESRFLLDYVDNIFFSRWPRPLGDVLEAWLELRGGNSECDELIYRRLLETDLRDKKAVQVTQEFIGDLLAYCRKPENE